MKATLRNLLWIDCLGAGLAGVVILALSSWLSWFYSLPLWFLMGIGVVNLVYGAFSFSIASRARRELVLVTALALANSAWGLFCFLVTIFVFDIASIYGIVHLIIEGLYVGGLGWLEWRERYTLCTPIITFDT